MSDITASAPGKVMLAGEYAVLEGADAVMVAVNRRVHARVRPLAAEPGQDAGAFDAIAPAHAAALAGEAGTGTYQSPFLRAVRDRVIAGAGPGTPEARAAVRLEADSSALRARDGAKLGLGSSAAVTVAASACALAHGPQTPSPAQIHRLAHIAHGAAQASRGARGSGADIAAAVYGGALAVRVRPNYIEPVVVRPLMPDLAGANERGLHLVFLWTGSAASTPALLASIWTWRDSNPSAYSKAMVALADASTALIAALRPSGTADEVVAAVEAGREAVAALGRAAGLAIETEVHRAITELAQDHGGAAKPTGAGAGDIALAAFASAAQAAAFRSQASAQGIAPLDLCLDQQGVSIAGLAA